MPPQTIALIVGLVEETVKVAPQFYADLKEIFAKPEPTPADWQALREKILAQGYFDYVPASDLPR